MSLDWNVGDVPNYETRCWERTSDGKKQLNADTEALVWGALMVDMASIKTANIEEWCFRIAFLSRVGMSWMDRYENGKHTPFFPSREAIEDHIGLTTNVSLMSRAKWVNKIKRRLERETSDTVAHQLTKREKENNT